MKPTIYREIGICLLLFVFLQPFGLVAQEGQKDKSVDLGINITSALSSFSGNGNFLEASDFPISLRIKSKKNVLRIGLGLTGTQSEFFDDITFAFRESSERAVFGRVGFERNRPLNEKWTFFWGVDGIASFEMDKVTIQNASVSEISTRSIGVGGGMLAGIKYYLHENLYFSTTATLYFLQKFNQKKESGVTFLELNTTSQDFALQPPLFIYLNYAF